MKLILGLIIFPEIWVKVAELIEFLDKLVKFLLLVVRSMKKTQESFLNLREILNDPLSLTSSKGEHLFHLRFVVKTQLFPVFHQSGFKVVIKI